MGRRLFYLPIISLCIALFTGNAAKAQGVKSAAVPAKVQGNWALPDCKSYEEAVMITRSFYLKSTPEGSQFWPAETLSRKKDYWVMSIEGERRPVRLEEDAVLKIGKLPDDAPPKWPKNWESLPLDGKREYMGCAEIPALLPDPLVRVMANINKIEAACRDSLTKNCKRLLFGIADDDKNRKISVKEMKMAGAMLTGLSLLIESHIVSRGDLDKALYDSLRESDRIAAAVGQDLAYEDFKGFAAKAESPLLNSVLESIGNLFPAFRPVP